MPQCQELTKLVAAHVTNLFIVYQKPVLVYHNVSHTQEVVDKCIEIAGNYTITEKGLFILLVAAWFHDTGHLTGQPKNHEARSILFMKEFMALHNISQDTVAMIEQCIASTQLPSHPQFLLAKILCDADLYHLGTEEFFETDELVKKEFELQNHFMPPNWKESTLAMLKNHTYYTEYCRAKLTKGKLKNIRLLQELIDKKK